MTLQIGKNIRQIRELKGYSQEYMASKLNISQRAYSNIESNNTKIDVARLNTIAEILEVNTLDILTFSERVLFTNTNCTQSSIGMFNTVHLGQAELNKVQEARIQELQNEVKHLREQVIFLQELLKKSS